MSVFDPSSKPTNSNNKSGTTKQLFDRAWRAAAAYPYIAVVIGAFLLLSVLSFVSALFRAPTPPAPPVTATPSTVIVPATPPPPAAVAPPPPAAGFVAPATNAAPVAAGPTALPPQQPLDAPMQRGANVSFSINTAPRNTRTTTFVEVSTEGLSADDAQGTFAWAGMKDRFSTTWPSSGTVVQVKVTGFVRIDAAGPQNAVLTVAQLGRCELEVGPTGNQVASLEAGNPQAVTAVPLLLEPGFYRISLACSVQHWRRIIDGMVKLALSPEGGQPRVVELWTPAAAVPASAEPAAPAP